MQRSLGMHTAIPVRTRVRVVRAITVRSVSSTAQGKKLTEAGQPEAIVRAMIQKKGMLVTLASNQRQERAVSWHR
jgi:hypothetical protein